MRYDTEHKERTRRKVVHEAAAAICEHGPDRIGVADLMAKAGLTHGGFYAHFKSKDELVAEAISHIFDDRYEFFLSCTKGQEPAKGLAKFIDEYVCARHRDEPHKGCPMPSLSGDLARMPVAARKRFGAGAEHITDSIAEILRVLKRPDPDRLAVSILAEMVGALALSRAVSDPELSDRILKSSRDDIKARVGLASAHK
jgi:TetR/AcrR family transcriptional regulator, transcriptional repressor for nem operon